MEKKSQYKPGFSTGKPRPVWVYMEKLRLDGTLTSEEPQGILVADTELQAAHFVVKTPGNNFGWAMLIQATSGIAKHCKNFLWMPSDWCCKDFWKPIAKGPLYLPYDSSTGEWKGASPQHTEVKEEWGYSQQHELRHKAVLYWDFKHRPSSVCWEITGFHSVQNVESKHPSKCVP